VVCHPAAAAGESHVRLISFAVRRPRCQPERCRPVLCPCRDGARGCGGASAASAPEPWPLDRRDVRTLRRLISRMPGEPGQRHCPTRFALVAAIGVPCVPASADRRLPRCGGREAPPPLVGGGRGEGFGAARTPPPNPLPQGEGELFLANPTVSFNLDALPLTDLAAAGTSREGAHQDTRQPDAQGSDRVRHVALGAQWQHLWVDNLGKRQIACHAGFGDLLRGEASPARRSGTRRQRCRDWRDGESPASRGRRSDPAQPLA
jgi:hypothetical protein